MMKLETNNLNAEFYLASLALGVLEAIKQGAINPEMGIWSLGRLQCSEQFDNSSVFSNDLKYVIGCMDEIAVRTDLDPHNGIEKQQKMVEDLKEICLKILKGLDVNKMDLRILLSMNDD